MIERAIASARGAESGKPADIVEDGGRRGRKFPVGGDAARAAVRQDDGKQTVEQLVKAAGATVKAFTLFVVGEGIEEEGRFRGGSRGDGKA